MSGKKVVQTLGKIVVIVIAVIIFGNFATSSTAGTIGVIIAIVGGLIWIFKRDNSESGVSSKSSISQSSYQKVMIHNTGKYRLKVRTNGTDIYTLNPKQKSKQDCRIGSTINIQYPDEMHRWYPGTVVKRGDKIIQIS